MTKLKICGLKPGDDLSFTSTGVVTHVGFVFVPKSKRCVTLEEARAMRQHVHPNCEGVGVFVDLPVEQVIKMAKYTGMNCVQLHGQESPQDCEEIRQSGLQVWKAIRVADETADEASLVQQVKSFAPMVDAILFDAAPPKGADAAVSGGHGRTFDWRVIPSVINLASKSASLPPVWVAGGIHPGNVHRLFDVFVPFGVDVSSGVEEASKKSQVKIQEMMEAVSSHDETTIS